MRGFQSSVDDKLVFGLGEIDMIDSLVVEWPDGQESVQTGLKANQLIKIDQAQAKDQLTERKTGRSGWSFPGC
jgi:enediyne biosynthesis protein E4